MLVLDLDGQADLTTGIGFKRDIYGADGDCILSLLLDLKADPNALIRSAPNDDFDVIPGNMQMYLAEQSLMGQRNRERTSGEGIPAHSDGLRVHLGRLPASAECGDR